MARINLPSTGFGTTSNITSIQNATSIAVKVKSLVDNVANLTGFNGITPIQIDDGTNIKFTLGYLNQGSGTSRFSMSVPGQGGAFVDILNSALPATGAGNDIIVYAYYHASSPAFVNGIDVYDTAGNLLGSQNNSGVNEGTLPTSSGIGIVRINSSGGHYTTVASAFNSDAIAIYSAENLTGSFQWAQPLGTDANQLEYWNFDEGSGSTSTGKWNSNVITWTNPAWQTGGTWDLNVPTIVGQQVNYQLGTPFISAGPVLFPSGQQVNLIPPGPQSVVRVDTIMYPQPTDIPAVAMQVGTATVSTTNQFNVQVSPASQVYALQVGTPTLNLLVPISAAGQQVNYKLGSVIVNTSNVFSVTAQGQQFAWGLGAPTLVSLNFPPSNLLAPAQTSFFTIESCPNTDLMTKVESNCGQVTVSQVYKYDSTITYNGLHTYGAS